MHQNINKLLTFEYEYDDYFFVSLLLLGKLFRCLHERMLCNCSLQVFLLEQILQFMSPVN